MSADRLNRTRAVMIGLPKREPTKGRSVHERLKNMWQVDFREHRNVVGPTRSDTGRHDQSSKTRPDKPEVSSQETPKNIWQVGFREGRNVGGPTRLDTGRHDPSNKLRPDKPEDSSRET